MMFEPVTLIILMIFGLKLFTIWTRHRIKLEEMRQRSVQVPNNASSAQMLAIQTEVQQLRDTCTQFDMSLEHSLKRLDDTVTHIEQRLRALETNQNTDPQRNYQNI